ncbi:Lsr2 family protein [Streptomyces sp. NPDC051561]|uniref:Lsr2 family protein n=1 Tax=Streptomyces sp. NPDC051561 TaxID=3365658 RepID=UPI0037941430
MAQKVEILLIDDIDGGEANETVTFSLDGKAFEIDLTTANAEKLRGLLDPYTKNGRRTGGKQVASRVTRGSSKASTGGGSDTAAIRQWAKKHGHNVNERGRIPAAIQEAYKKANS